MNITYSLDQIQETGGLNAHSIMKQSKLDKMAKLMEIKSNKLRRKQPEIAKLLELSSTIQRYRRQTYMFPHYRIPPSSKTNQRKQKKPNTNLGDVKVTSNDLKMNSNDLKTTSKIPGKDKRKQIELWCKN